MATAAGTLFPKSYVVERIEARIASIKARRGEAARRSKALNRQATKAIQAYAKAYKQWVSQSAAAAHEFAVDAASPDGAVQALRDFRRAVPKTPEPPSLALFKESGEPIDRRGARWWNASEEHSAVAELWEQEQKEVREQGSLEHALAYLQGTPVDAFSLTSLKQLGLLDAVKFDLGAVEAEKKGRR